MLVDMCGIVLLALCWRRIRNRGHELLRGSSEVVCAEDDGLCAGADHVTDRASDHDSLVAIIELGASEHRVALERRVLTSRDALKRHIVRACVRQLGRQRTPSQWLDLRRGGPPPPMNVFLLYEHEMAQMGLSGSPRAGETTVEQIRAATSVRVMPT